MVRTYYVYILATSSRALYIGLTNDVVRRVGEHRAGLVRYTSQHGSWRLVHIEPFADVRYAIAREKEIKAWRRSKKLALIGSTNPAWDDYAEGWEAGAFDRPA